MRCTSCGRRRPVAGAPAGHDVLSQPRRGLHPRAVSYMALTEAYLTVLRGLDEQAAAAPAYRLPIADMFRVLGALIGLRAGLGDDRARPLAASLPSVPASKISGRGWDAYEASAVMAGGGEVDWFDTGSSGMVATQVTASMRDAADVCN